MDTRRLILATLLSAAVLFGFEYFFPQAQQQTTSVAPPAVTQSVNKPDAAAQAGDTAEVSHSDTPDSTASDAPARVAIDAPAVMGSINLRGARLDDLLLKQYRETVKPDSPDVRVLSPAATSRADFVDFGWRAAPDTQVRLPDSQSLWHASGATLDDKHPLTLSWDNGQGLTFEVKLAVDQDFMFTLTQSVHNATAQAVTLYPFYRVNRGYTPEETGGMLVHEGPISVVDGRLNEGSYKSVRTGGTPPDNISWSHQGTGGWAGITDKYWLMAVLPDQTAAVVGSYGWQATKGQYQVGFTGAAPVVVAPGASVSSQAHVFAGAKEVRLLDRYETQLHVPMFWKAVDFGWLSFLTRPVFFVLDLLYQQFGSFGWALLIFTVIVKVVFLPLTVKQMRMTWKMARLKPQVDAIRARHKDDPMALQQNIMMLYRKENVSMFGGFLPLFIQAPVFWCLYKDLYVTIEMRHAAFVGWVKDLSAPDPTNVFNLFGLVPFDPTQIMPFLVLGAWPIMYGATLFLMQKVSSSASNMDPAQQKVMMFIPLLFTFFMARQPVGLVIYYCWSNILTALQQVVIMGRLRAADAKPQLVEKK